MARAIRLASLPESHFWDLTPGEVDEILREVASEWQVKERNAAHNAAMICACLYNCHRDAKAHPEPFTAADFLRKEPQEKRELSADEVAAKVGIGMGILAKIN